MLPGSNDKRPAPFGAAFWVRTGVRVKVVAGARNLLDLLLTARILKCPAAARRRTFPQLISRMITSFLSCVILMLGKGAMTSDLIPAQTTPSPRAPTTRLSRRSSPTLATPPAGATSSSSPPTSATRTRGAPMRVPVANSSPGARTANSRSRQSGRSTWPPISRRCNWM
jgi:hypothetical protein